MGDNHLHHSYGFAQKHGSFDIYDDWKRTLEHGHDPNEDWNAGRDGRPYGRRASPLLSAVLDGDVKLVELLLDHSADAEKHNPDGKTALQEAVVQGDEDVVEVLLRRGVDVATTIKSEFLKGGTALHIAVVEGAVKVARTLSAHGANPLARTTVGWTAVDLAVLDHQKSMLSVLLGGDRALGDMFKDCPVEMHDVGSDTDRASTAVHIVEHGARYTERKHVCLYYGCLTSILAGDKIDDSNGESVCRTLIREMEAALLKQAGITGGPSWPRNLCENCERFEAQDSNEVFKIFDHCRNFATLQQSAKKGCNLCQYFVEVLEHHWCLLHQIDGKYRKRWGVSPGLRMSIEKPDNRPVPRMGDRRLIVVCGDKISFTDLNHVQKYINEAVAQTGPSDAQGTGSERSLAIAKAWLRRCENEHSLCRRSDLGQLPTRVIDVDGPRIYVSKSERVPYTTLSYCWGKDQNLRLLSTGTEEYYEHIPQEKLPRTIADAISITRDLGVKYLWIDALCILQDSAEDLKHELSYMGDIYANSYFTIAAKTSASCDEGCFRSRDWPTSAIVPLNIRLPEGTLQSSNDTHQSTLNKRTSCLNRLMALPRHRFPTDHGPASRERPILETRGWALQEEVLSHRLLVCGEHELSWICLGGQCSERMPEEGTVKFFKSHWQNSIRHALVTGVAGHGTRDEHDTDELFEFWLDTVEDYLQRQLSEHRDKLVAIGGVQSAIGRILDDEVVAGVWKGKFFAPSLLWQVGEGKASAFACPSWSWISVPDTVKYARLPYRMNKPWGWYNEFAYHVEPVAWHVDNTNQLDRISGHVEVRCKLLREAELDCERYVCDDFLNRPPKSRTGAEAIHYQVFPDSPNDAARDAWLMPVRTSKHVADCKGRGYKYDIETQLLYLEKISQGRMEFRRFGLVMTRSWKNKWLGKAGEETICLY